VKTAPTLPRKSPLRLKRFRPKNPRLPTKRKNPGPRRKRKRRQKSLSMTPKRRRPKTKRSKRK
jgi:hypothetical protein